MLVVISPAKALDMEPVAGLPMTTPEFQDRANALAAIARDLSADELAKLMSISDKLAVLNRDRFAAFADAPAPEDVKQAIMAFAGDTYKGLEAKTLDPDALDWAQGHLRILSGLYGALRPFDGMQAYRLEMGSRLANPAGKTLYAYWGDTIAQALTDQARTVGTDILVNCASQEYFKAADRDALALRVVTPQFYEDKNGTPKIVSFYAKQARGAMARFVMEGRLSDPNDLLSFGTGGYQHAPDLSTPDRPAFLRNAG